LRLRLPMLALSFLLGIAVSASGQSANPPQSPTRPVEGAGVFRNHCAVCHGLDGQGKGLVSKALKDEVPDLTKLSKRNGGTFPAVRIRTLIMFGADAPLPAHGSKQMPIWGPIFHEIEFDEDLGNVRLENLIRYLESIQRK
jgi:mono/diheme cytochrome c family protein